MEYISKKVAAYGQFVLVFICTFTCNGADLENKYLFKYSAN